MRYLGWQLKKGILSIESVFVFIIVIVCYIFVGESVVSYKDSFLSDFLMISSNNIIALIFPMLVCLPVAMKYVTEYESGYIFLALSKMPVKRYICTKLLTNALVGGLLISIPAVIYLLRIIVSKGISAGSYMNSAWQISLFPNLYETHPLVYAFIMISFFFLSGAVFASLGLGIAATLKKKYLAILVPLTYYLSSAIVFPNIFKYFDATSLYVLNNNHHPNLLISFIYAMILLVIGVTMFVMGVHRNVK